MPAILSLLATPSTDDTDARPVRVAFVCVQNAGRSQMAAAFAERERHQRNVDDSIEILTGGTRPADAIHETVIDVMDEVGIDLRPRGPRRITHEDLQGCEYVVTMGCSAEGVCPATWSGENRDWGLDDPHGGDLDTIRDIRDDVEARVAALFDDLTSSPSSTS